MPIAVKKWRAQRICLRSQSLKHVDMCPPGSSLDKISGRRDGGRVKQIFIKGEAKTSHGFKHESTWRFLVETEP